MSFEILTDSSCNLSKETIDAFGIHILRLSFENNTTGALHYSYDEDQNIDMAQFYQQMAEGVSFRTSLPNILETEKVVKPLLEAHKDILYIGFSSNLSGTFQSTNLVLKQLQNKYPDRLILTVDTLAASLGEGMLVYHACKLAQSGKSIEEVHQWLEDNKFNIAHWFTVGDLEYLFRGGRVSRASAFAGDLLHIKPILHMNNEGQLVLVSKARGRHKSIRMLFEKMKSSLLSLDSDQEVFIVHGNCLDEAKSLAKLINKQFNINSFHFEYLEPVIGSHCGPGTIGLFFFAHQR